jgi:hypothetical protein
LRDANARYVRRLLKAAGAQMDGATG